MIPEIIDQAKNLRVIGDSEILSRLIPFDIAGENADDDFQIIQMCIRDRQ